MKRTPTLHEIGGLWQEPGHFVPTIRTPFIAISASSFAHESIPATTKPTDPVAKQRKPFKMSGETKVADVASQLRERIPVNRNSMMRLFEWYHKTYFRTNSFQPVVHAMIGIGVLGYMIEYPHIKHEIEEQKKHANDV